MKWKKKVDLPDEVPVPEGLRTKLYRHLRGCRGIDIRVEVSHNKYLQENRIDFANKSASTMPDDTPEEICAALSLVMHNAWLEKHEDEEGSEPLRFRLEAILHKDATRSQSGFGYTWDPDGDDRYAEDPEDWMRQDAFSHSQVMLDRQLAYTEELHSVILKLANMNAEPIAASSNLAQWGGQMAMEGMKATLISHKMNFDRDDAKSKHEEETKRSQAAWERAGKLLEFGVKAAAEKLGDYMGKKRKGSRGAPTMRDAAEAMGVDLEDDDGDASSEDDDQFATDLRERPITTFCGLFGESLSNRQRKDLSALVGKHYPLFDELFCVEDDDEGVRCWDALSDKLTALKLLELNALLDQDQKDQFAKVSELVALRKKAAEEADEPTEE